MSRKVAAGDLPWRDEGGRRTLGKLVREGETPAEPESSRDSAIGLGRSLALPGWSFAFPYAIAVSATSSACAKSHKSPRR